MRITENQSLYKIESKLQEKLKDVVVVSEINLEKKYFNTLVNLLKTYVTVNNEENMIDHLWKRYPNVSLVVTVFVALYEYDSNLWGNFSDITDIEDTEQWKKNMLSFLQSNNIKVFHEKTRQRYFNTVLGHAGIPSHSVPKLIENIIIPANEKGLNEVNIYENLKRKVNDNSVHKGVKSFIELGDKVSFSMIHRIQNVWRNQNRPFSIHYNGYLPNHILWAMDAFIPKQEEGWIGKLQTTFCPI